jgi:hypothetical protein
MPLGTVCGKWYEAQVVKLPAGQLTVCLSHLWIDRPWSQTKTGLCHQCIRASVVLGLSSLQDQFEQHEALSRFASNGEVQPKLACRSAPCMFDMSKLTAV